MGKTIKTLIQRKYIISAVVGIVLLIAIALGLVFLDSEVPKTSPKKIELSLDNPYIILTLPSPITEKESCINTTVKVYNSGNIPADTLPFVRGMTEVRNISIENPWSVKIQNASRITLQPGEVRDVVLDVCVGKGSSGFQLIGQIIVPNNMNESIKDAKFIASFFLRTTIA
jgi:hypothetical protein